MEEQKKENNSLVTKNEQERDLFFSGDIHGEIRELVWKLTQQYRITDANVIILGDCGVGFNKPGYYNILFKKLSQKLEDNNVTIYMIRGNHDNKEYWDDESLLEDFPRFRFLRDHEVVTLSGKTIYPIGGARSMDMNCRINYNNKMEKLGSSRRSWWSNEIIEKKYKDLPNRVDIICSHSSPISFEPIVTRYSEISEEIYNDILDERRYLDYVFQNVRCKNWYYGHYHQSITSSLEGVVYKCLGIMEIYQRRN